MALVKPKLKPSPNSLKARIEMTPLSECSLWHAEQARLCASKALSLRGQAYWALNSTVTNAKKLHAEADALELMAAKHRLWARSCQEADSDEPQYVNKNNIGYWLPHQTNGAVIL